MTEPERTSSFDEQPTCGQGLAAHSAVPEKMSAFLEALVDNLEAHVPTIDTRDPEGRKEEEAYEHLVSEYAAIAARLASTAEQMRGYRHLPAARHHPAALAEPKLLDIFERFVVVEGELAQLLRESAEHDRRFLQEARSAAE